MKFVHVHCIKGKVNHSALCLKINLCYNPNLILFYVLSPRNSFTILWFFFVAEVFFLDMQSSSIMFSFVLQEADVCSGVVFFVLFCWCFDCLFVCF